MTGATSSVSVMQRSEVLGPEPAAALAALLDVSPPGALGDAILPLLWHWVYLLDWTPTSALGPDGHRVVGGMPAPPGEGRRRMFAGGRVRSPSPMRIGETVTCTSSVRSSTLKQGRSGALTFVTVGREWKVGDRLCIDEEQDIVYSEAPTRGREPDGAPSDSVAAAGRAHSSTVTNADGEPATANGVGSGTDWEVQIDPVLLFRFSALTYNAHRIHYDRDYARDVEGYSGLLVHGPLQALLMAEAMRRGCPDRRPDRFSYRLLAPLFDTQGLVVSEAGESTHRSATVRDLAGRTTAVSEAHLRGWRAIQ